MNCLEMGMSHRDAAEWDFVEYSRVIPVWNDRHAEKDEDGDTVQNDPPPIEWMIADDERKAAKGYRVN